MGAKFLLTQRKLSGLMALSLNHLTVMLERKRKERKAALQEMCFWQNCNRLWSQKKSAQPNSTAPQQPSKVVVVKPQDDDQAGGDQPINKKRRKDMLCSL